MVIQHPFILVVTAFLLINQLVFSIDPNHQCGTQNYSFDETRCSISDNVPGGRYFCVALPAPQLIAINEFPRMIKIGIPMAYNDALVTANTSYCGTQGVTLSLYEYWVQSRADSYENEDWMRNSWRYKALGAVTNLKADFYIKSRTGTWDPKGQFGPFFYRLAQANEDYLDFTHIQGFERYDSDKAIAYFKFFLPNSMKTDPTVADWLSQLSTKTEFEVGADLVSSCKDAITTRGCEAKSEITPLVLRSFIPRILTKMDTKVLEAILKSDKLVLKVEWSDFDKTKYTKTAVETYTESCKPVLKVAVYDSNPTPHGNTGDVNTFKNDKIRSVLITFSQTLTWDLITKQPKASFELTNDNEWYMDFKLMFLKNINSWTGRDPQDVFYKDWSKETGLSIALTVCMCDNAKGITDRNLGCREYMHQAVTIDETYWKSNALKTYAQRYT